MSKKTRANYRRWYRKNKLKKKDTDLKRMYGISLAEYSVMLMSQHGKCAICKRTAQATGKKWLQVDHCHTSKRIRGLLCGPCNTGLGGFQDIPSRLLAAAEYVQ